MKIIKQLSILVLAAWMMGCEATNEFSQQVDQFSTHISSFEQTSVRRKVDILFVVDNSTSMARDQANISVQFQNFITNISQADYRIGFINTDATSQGYENIEGFHGNLKTMGPHGEKYLDKSMGNIVQIFKKGILEQVNSPCTSAGLECDEEPMKAIMKAISKKDKENLGFFRPGASFVPIILSDEDEKSIGGKSATQPEELISYIQSELKLSEYDVTSFVIAIPPSDSACLELQRKESNSGLGANYGTLIWSLADLSGGFGVSICHPNFGTELRRVSKYLESRLIYHSVLLDPPPAKKSSIKVRVTDKDGNVVKIKWKLIGKDVLKFNPPPPEKSTIEITYKKKNIIEVVDDEVLKEIRN